MENKFLKGLKRGWENPTEHTEMTEANNKSKAEARDEIWLRQDDQQGQARNIKKAGKAIEGSVNKALFHTLWEMNVKTVTKDKEKDTFHRNVMQSLLKQTSGSCICDD